MTTPDHIREPTAGWPTERAFRLVTGLVLFAYATSHLVNHAFGIRSVDAMQKASTVLLAPWQTTVGRSMLYTSFLIHGTLGLWAFYRRRHLRMPAGEAWQLALGLAIPLLLIPHAGTIRFGDMGFGLVYDYPKVLYELWVMSPGFALPRQLLLLLVLWVHGCIGLRAWLASKPWYHRAPMVPAALAVLVPAMAILGLVDAGLDVRDLARSDPSLEARYGVPDLVSEAGVNSVLLTVLINILLLTYAGLVAAVLALRALRDWHNRHIRGLRITYPGGRIVTVPSGFSVLEASRWAGIPHESICGGRGRCSTCRIRVASGPPPLPPPNTAERRTLDRIKAPEHVRLACQLRPTADISVHPLVTPGRSAASPRARFAAAVAGGREQEIVAMFVDLRDSTKLATGRLPYDALFLLDRYIQVVTGAIAQHGGHVTSIAGDGIMSVYGVETDPATAARQALAAARDAWTGLVALNTELASELAAPLRIGIGLHAGPAVVGWLPTGGTGSLQFLGDTGNVAAKLEGETKQMDCTLIISLATLALAGLRATFIRTVTIAGNPVEVAPLQHSDELDRLLGSTLQPATVT